MNNNICKWGNSHKQTLLYKVKNISKKLARKLFMSLLVTSAIFCTANLHTAYAAHSLENSRTGFSITVDNSDSAGMSLTDKRIQSKISKYLENQENIAQTTSVPVQAASIQNAQTTLQTTVQTTAQTAAAGANMQGSAPNSTQVSAPVSVPVFSENTAVPKSPELSAVSAFSQPASQPIAQSAVSSPAVPAAASSVLSANSAPVSNQPVSGQPGFTPKTAVFAPQSTTDDSSAGSGFSMIIDNSDSAGMSLTDNRIQSKLSKYLENQETIAQNTNVPVQAENVQSTAQTAAQTAQAAPAALAAPVSAAETAAVNTAAASTLSLPMSTAVESAALPKAQTVYSPVLEQYTYAAAAENNAENTPKTLEQEMLAQSLAEHNAAAYGTAAYSAALNTADTAVYTPALQSYTYALPAASQTDSGSLSDTVSLSGAAFTPTAAISAAPAFAPLAAYSTGTDTPVSPLTGMTEINNGQIIADGTPISDTIYNNIQQRNEINANTDFNNVEINYTKKYSALIFDIDSNVTELNFSTVTISSASAIQFNFANDFGYDFQILTEENTFINKNSDPLADVMQFNLAGRTLHTSIIHGPRVSFVTHGGSVKSSTFDVKSISFTGLKKDSITNSNFNFKEFGDRTFFGGASNFNDR